MNMKIASGVCWGFVPARGGSQSVPLKNIRKLGFRPLLDYCVLAGQAASSIDRIVCSTDSHVIANRAQELQIETFNRPEELGGDDVEISDVVIDFLHSIFRQEGVIAECIALLQPTSPFILPDQIDKCCLELFSDPLLGSAQTVILCPHNSHAYNQRIIKDGNIEWKFPKERRVSYNKQSKPSHYLFGNLVVFRSEALIKTGGVFAAPSRAIIVPEVYGFDCDGREDFRRGDFQLDSGLVSLPHLA